ncbi:MAG: hypothetical protein ACLGGX_00975 [Bdellovibrionia bacterium]
MEAIAPIMEMIWQVRFGLEEGVSIRASLTRLASDDVEAKDITLFLSVFSQGMPLTDFYADLKSPQRQLFFKLMEKGLRGDSILKPLKELELETQKYCEEHVEWCLSVLPFKMLLPLFFLQLPAFLLVLFGPILFNLLHSIRGI